MATAETDVPVTMRKVYWRLERWRSQRTGRDPIPESLWAAAVKLAREHGVFRTSQVLHLEYGKLKRLLEASGSVTPPTAPRTAFLELMAPAGLSECVIELAGPRGKMRIQWKGTTAPDLAGLSRVLWESA
jgi:hypothetical protein